MGCWGRKKWFANCVRMGESVLDVRKVFLNLHAHRTIIIKHAYRVRSSKPFSGALGYKYTRK